MNEENRKEDKYYKFLFYYDHTTTKLIVYDPNANRYTLNFANKWSYLIFFVLFAFMITAGIVGANSRLSK